MSLTWRIKTKLEGALTDADALPTITIFLSANSNIIVPTTTMTRVSQGVYEYVQTGESVGVSYYALWDATVDGEAVSQQVPWTKIAGVDSWYYSDRAGVATVLDAATIAVTWDMDDANGEDAGAMVQDGVKADGYIDTFLANYGLSVPIVLSGTGAAAGHIVASLADASNHLTIWNGWKRRGLEELSSKTGRSSADIAGLMSGYKAYADELLDRLVNVIRSSNNGNAGIQAIVPTREQGCYVSGLGWSN
jgi:hypothetical protein